MKIETKLMAFLAVFIISTQIGLEAGNPAGEKMGKKSSSLLWEISGNGLEKPSYLYGTIHLIAEKDFFIRKEVTKAFEKSEQTAFEIKINDMSLMMRMMEAMKLEEGKSLKDLMSGSDYQELSKYLSDSMNLDISQFDNMKPLYLYQQFMQGFIKEEVVSFEMHFLQEAIKGDKEIFGLETLEDQMGVFDAIPMEEQIGWILQGIRENQEYSSMWDDMVEAYKNEDIVALDRLMKEESPELKAYEDIFLTNRNKNWIPRIAELASQKVTFFAVGAGHLPGENGVIELLRQAGYKVKAL